MLLTGSILVEPTEEFNTLRVLRCSWIGVSCNIVRLVSANCLYGLWNRRVIIKFCITVIKRECNLGSRCPHVLLAVARSLRHLILICLTILIDRIQYIYRGIGKSKEREPLIPVSSTVSRCCNIIVIGLVISHQERSAGNHICTAGAAIGTAVICSLILSVSIYYRAACKCQIARTVGLTCSI